MDFTRQELEDADLLLVVSPDGIYKWSSHRSDAEVASFLRNAADEIEHRGN